jgi:hypothetical protein
MPHRRRGEGIFPPHKLCSIQGLNPWELLSRWLCHFTVNRFASHGEERAEEVRRGKGDEMEDR